jgi:hypothetical protein
MTANTKTKTVQVSTWKNLVSTCIKISDREEMLEKAKQTIGHEIASLLVGKMKGKGETLDSAKSWFKDQCSKHLPKGDKKAHLAKVANRLKEAVGFVPYMESNVIFDKPLTRKQALLVNGHVTDMTGKDLSEMRGEDWSEAYQDVRKQFGVATLKKQMSVKGTDDDTEEELDIDLFFDTARIGLATARKTVDLLGKAKDGFTELLETLGKLTKEELDMFSLHASRKGFAIVKASK